MGGHARILAVDLGGTRVKWGVLENGVVQDLRVRPTATDGVDAIMDQLVGIAAQRAARTPWALCCPGVIDHGSVRLSTSLRWRDVPLARILRDRGVEPAIIVNDVSAAAVGEAAGQTVALVQLGTGLGTRLVIAGRVVEGTGGFAGAAHFRVQEGGADCSCGSTGCLQAYAGWWGIRRQAAAAGHELTAPVDLLAAADREEWAAHILADALAAAGTAAAVLVAAADPGLVRLGGGLAAAFGERLARAAHNRIAAMLHPSLAERTSIELSTLGEGAGLIGLGHLMERATR